MPKRYLIFHLNSNGDLLYATAIARQLKEKDDPGCHITWAVATPFKGILLHNPYIDRLWEIMAENYTDIKLRAFREAEADIKAGMARNEWDEVICPQLMYENMWRYDGTIRRAVLRAYRGTVTDITPVVRLSEAEVANVGSFAAQHSLEKYQNIILFECSPLSGQSSVTPQLAVEVAEEILPRFPETAFILSSNKQITHSDRRIIDGSRLTFRENAELTHYCTHLIGCSSGITWISTSDWAKKLPMLQLSSTGINPIGRDFEREGLDTSRLIEMYRFSIGSVINCISMILQNNITGAKTKYNETVPPSVEWIEGIFLYLINHRYLSKALTFIARNLKQHRFHTSIFKTLIKLPFSVPFKIWKKRKL